MHQVLVCIFHFFADSLKLFSSHFRCCIFSEFLLMFENEGMNILALCFEALIDFSLLFLSLLDQKFYFVFN
jgi:hypothetical protein